MIDAGYFAKRVATEPRQLKAPWLAADAGQSLCAAGQGECQAPRNYDLLHAEAKHATRTSQPGLRRRPLPRP